MKDYFAEKSKSYEKEVSRSNNIGTIADAILQRLTYDKENFHVMDFGSGTGLLSEQIAPYVKKMTTIDISPSMNEQLRAKQDIFTCELEMLELDLVKETIPHRFHGIVSSMTMHHVEDILAMFRKFYAMLHQGGSIAIADLDKEDGTFHTDDMGVFHFGFEQDAFAALAREAGFQDVAIATVSTIKKPYGEYPIFLLTGYKR